MQNAISKSLDVYHKYSVYILATAAIVLLIFAGYDHHAAFAALIGACGWACFAVETTFTREWETTARKTREVLDRAMVQNRAYSTLTRKQTDFIAKIMDENRELRDTLLHEYPLPPDDENVRPIR